MTFTETGLPGAFIITPDLIEDERGCFARIYCRREFADQGLNPDFVQSNISFNRKKGTLRGLHYQVQPHGDTKLVRCTAGTIFDVIIDLRRESPSFKRWWAVTLSGENRKLLYIPAGFAHGFQTLTDHAEVTYHHTAFYSPDFERGVRYDDPVLAVAWPLPVAVISIRDHNHPPMGLDFKGIES